MTIFKEIVTGFLILAFLGGLAAGVTAIVTNVQLTLNGNATSENKCVELVESPIYHTLFVHLPESGIPVTIVPSPGKHSYIENENVVVEIEFEKFNEYWEAYLMFDGWSGDVNGTKKKITVVMDSDKTIRPKLSWRYLGENDYALLGGKLKDLPVSYSINPENPYGVNENRVTAAIKRAFELWDEHTSTELFDNNVKTTEISHSGADGQNVVFFDDNIDFLGLTYWWRRGDEITEFDIVLNPVILRRYGLFETTLHEVGHALGLGHPKHKGTIMGVLFITDSEENSLAPGDIMGLHALYGK